MSKDRKEIAAILRREWGRCLSFREPNPFKSRAFHNAARAMEGVVGDLGAMIESGELLKVQGIGKSIAAHHSDLVRKGSPRSTRSSCRVPCRSTRDAPRSRGSGPRRSGYSSEKMKISSVEALAKAAGEGKLAFT